MADLPNVQPDSRAATVLDAPDKMASVRELFGIDSDMEVPAFSEADERVPDLDPAYVFDRGHHAIDLRGLRAQPSGDDPGLSRHGQVKPY